MKESQHRQLPHDQRIGGLGPGRAAHGHRNAAIMTALISANRAPSVSESAPGSVTMSTPRKPTTSTAAGAPPARSLSHTMDTNAANSGGEKLMATAPASGIRLKASSSAACENDCDRPRSATGRAECERAAGGCKDRNASDRQHDRAAGQERRQRAQEQHFAAALADRLFHQHHVGIGISGYNPDRHPVCRKYQLSVHDAQAIRHDSHRLIIPSAHAPSV